jgi:opacity protein-like surface antigen
VSAAFRNDWEQTKHDFGSKTAPDLKQDVDNTVRQATGSEDPFARHEQAFRFGYGAQRHFGSQYKTWNDDLDKQLRTDYGSDYDRDRDYIRYAYEYKYDRGENRPGQRDESRP